MKNLFIFSCFLFFITLNAQTKITQKDKSIILLNHATELLKNNDKKSQEKAKQNLETIVYDYSKSPALEEALLLLGTYHLENDSDIDGQLYLKKFLKKFPNSPEAYQCNYLLYKSYSKMHNKFQKNIYLKKLYLYNPDGKYTSKIIGDLIILAVKEKNYKLGLDYIKKAMTFGKQSYEKKPIAFFSVGEIFFKTNNIDQAIKVFERLINLYGHHSISILGKERLAECYEKKENFELAKKFHLEILKNHQGTDAYAMSVSHLTNMYINKNISKIGNEKQNYEAIKLLNDIIKHKINYSKSILPIALQAKADYLFFKNKTSEGLVILKNLILKFPTSSFTELNREVFFKKLNQYVNKIFEEKKYLEIIKICEETKSLIFNEYNVQKILGDSYYAVGASLKAEMIYKKLIKNSGEKDLVKNSLFTQAELDYNKKEYARAGREYQLFAANFSDSIKHNISITKIVEILSILKKYPETIEFFEKNKESINTNELKEIAYYFVAKAYDNLEPASTDNAIKYYQKYLNLKPQNESMVFNAELYILNKAIISGNCKNSIKKIDALLTIKNDSFTRFLKVKELLKQNNIKDAKKELTKFKQEDYWSSLAKDYIDNFLKTKTLFKYGKDGNKIFKTPFD